jgi:type IV secretion system protein VirB6
MDFFGTFWTWLNAQLASYIGDNTARVAAVLEPALVALGTVYVMMWGYLQLTGRIEEPFTAGVKRIVTLALIFGVALHLWLYNTLLVDTFYRAPSQFAAAVVGASDPVRTIDAIWIAGGSVADQLYRDGGVVSLGYKLAGIVVWLVIGLLCTYTMFLLALSSVALSVLLALGPLFIVMLLFEGTRRFFEAWVAQLANYGLITILTVMVAALMLHLVQSYAQQTQALGTAIDTVDALNMLLVTVLVFLFMRQVMPVAGGLAGAVSLSSFGLVSRATGWVGALAAVPPARGAGWVAALGRRKVADYMKSRAARRGNAGAASTAGQPLDDSFGGSG